MRPGSKRRTRRPGASPVHRAARRLGALEYTLIALIVLGIGITGAMTILNPSA